MDSTSYFALLSSLELGAEPYPYNVDHFIASQNKMFDSSADAPPAPLRQEDLIDPQLPQPTFSMNQALLNQRPLHPDATYPDSAPPTTSNRSKWSKKEDDRLRDCPYLREGRTNESTKWKEVEKFMKDAGFDRGAKQCREHYINYVDPRLVDPAWYTNDINKRNMFVHCMNEETGIALGKCPKWVLIANKLAHDGKTVSPNRIKNFFHSTKEGKAFKVKCQVEKNGGSVLGKKRSNSNPQSSSDDSSRKKRSSGESDRTPPADSPAYDNLPLCINPYVLKNPSVSDNPTFVRDIQRPSLNIGS